MGSRWLGDDWGLGCKKVIGAVKKRLNERPSKNNRAGGKSTADEYQGLKKNKAIRDYIQLIKKIKSNKKD